MQSYKARPRERAEELLEGYLLEHKLEPGERLPPERELSQQWGISRSTLRTAISSFERDGLLYSREGSGTYAAQPKYTRDLRGLLSMSQAAASQGLVVTTRLLELKRMECGKNLAQRFGRMLGAPVYKVARLRSVGGAPLMMETAFLPAEQMPGLEDKELERRSLFSVLEEDYGLLPEQGDEKVGITYATAGEAELMGVKEGAPLFWIVSQTYDREAGLIEYCRAVARPDRMRLVTVLERQGEEVGCHEA